MARKGNKGRKGGGGSKRAPNASGTPLRGGKKSRGGNRASSGTATPDRQRNSKKMTGRRVIHEEGPLRFRPIAFVSAGESEPYELVKKMVQEPTSEVVTSDGILEYINHQSSDELETVSAVEAVSVQPVETADFKSQQLGAEAVDDSEQLVSEEESWSDITATPQAAQTPVGNESEDMSERPIVAVPVADSSDDTESDMDGDMSDNGDLDSYLDEDLYPNDKDDGLEFGEDLEQYPDQENVQASSLEKGRDQDLANDFDSDGPLDCGDLATRKANKSMDIAEASVNSREMDQSSAQDDREDLSADDDSEYDLMRISRLALRDLDNYRDEDLYPDDLGDTSADELIEQMITDKVDFEKYGKEAKRSQKNKQPMSRRRQERLEEREASRATNFGKDPQLWQKYPSEISIWELLEEVQAFVQRSKRETLKFPPLDSNANSYVTELGRMHGLATVTEGKHPKRFVVVVRTNRTGKLVDPSRLRKITSRRKRFVRTDSLNSAARPEKEKRSKNKFREGDIVGEDAAQISSESLGHKLMTKMGWTHGTGLGAARSGIVDPIIAKIKLSKRGLASNEMG